MALHTKLCDLLEAQEHGIAITLEPACVLDQNPFEPWEVTAYSQHFVGLLLIFDHDKARLGMVEEKPHVAGKAINEHAERDGARGLGSQLGIEPRGPVARDHRHRIPALQAKFDQAQAERAHMPIVVLPGDFLPNPVFFLAQGDLPCAISAGFGDQ